MNPIVGVSAKCARWMASGLAVLVFCGCSDRDEAVRLSRAPETEKRMHAADTAVAHRDPESIRILHVLANDEDVHVRGYAIRLMGETRDRSGVDILLKGLEDDRVWSYCRRNWLMFESLYKEPISATANQALERVTGVADEFHPYETSKYRQARVVRWRRVLVEMQLLAPE